MNYIKNEFNNFLTFCVKMFWCRWDKALFNWSMLYLVSVIFVYMGRESNLLFGNHTMSFLLLTSLVVTLEVTSISFIQKKKINKQEMLHENKNREFDV